MAGGCFAGQDSAASDSLQDDDLPMGGCDPTDDDCTDTGQGQGAPPGSPCDGTNQCGDGGVCAAPFDDGDVGALVCQLGCVQTGDPTAWCSDDATCCSGVCGAHGECLADEAADSAATGDAESGTDSGTTSASSGTTAGSGETSTGESTSGGTSAGSSTGEASTSGSSTSG